MTIEEIKQRLATFRQDIAADDSSWHLALIDFLEEALIPEPTPGLQEEAARLQEQAG